MYVVFFFFQAEDGIRDLVRSRGLGDVYKRQILSMFPRSNSKASSSRSSLLSKRSLRTSLSCLNSCLLYTSDAADERSSVDLGGRRIIKKKNREKQDSRRSVIQHNIVVS